MLMRNRTPFAPVLARGQIDDQLAVCDVVLRVAYSVDADGTLTSSAAPEPGPHDPPELSRVVLWRGVSVTAFGHALGPVRPPYIRPVRLCVGELQHRLIVFGPRVWERRMGGRLVASDPAPFEPVPLGWEHAYGGSFDLAPGYLAGTELPHPGGRLAHVLNPLGTGWYQSEAAATDQPLPQIENPQALVRAWHDAPTPAGMAPCRELPGLRLPLIERLLEDRQALVSMERLPPALAMMLAGRHHAPAPLVLERVEPATPLSIEGLGEGIVQLRIPPCPIAVSLRRSRHVASPAPRLRSVHIDADARRLELVWGHPHRYTRYEAPHWVEIIASESRAA
jgi:hypothetical protein